jgi:16S rRNA processing protein RimM
LPQQQPPPKRPARLLPERHPLSRPRKARAANPARSGSTRILVGVIGAAHGVRGEVRVKSYTSEPSAIATYGPLHDETGTRSFEFEALRPLRNDLFVARFKDVADRRAAEALTNTGLYVSRDRLAPLGEEEFLHADLIGLRAETPAGTCLGAVAAVQNFGAGDVLEIAPPEGETLLVAFTRASIPLVDLAGGRLVVDLPREVPGEQSESG